MMNFANGKSAKKKKGLCALHVMSSGFRDTFQLKVKSKPQAASRGVVWCFFKDCYPTKLLPLKKSFCKPTPRIYF